MYETEQVTVPTTYPDWAIRGTAADPNKDKHWPKISIVGTRTFKLRAKVQYEGHPAYHVSIGGGKWDTLQPDLQALIMTKAMHYIDILRDKLTQMDTGE